MPGPFCSKTVLKINSPQELTGLAPSSDQPRSSSLEPGELSVIQNLTQQSEADISRTPLEIEMETVGNVF